MDQERMTFWSPKNPVKQKLAFTDHWSKLRVKGESALTKRAFSESPPDKEMDKIVQTGQRGCEFCAPAQQTDRLKWDLTIPKPGKMNRNISNNANLFQRRHLYTRNTKYNQRAQEGFKYWPLDRPTVKPFGRYSLGSFKSVYGLGNAPRS